jgi:DNA end-binding protein Ku
MAQLLIESMESDWDPERFHDTHRQKVEALIEEKRSGHEIVLQEGPEPQAQVIDLMDALNASIAAATGTKTAKAKAKVTATSKATATSKVKPDTKKATRNGNAVPAKKAPAKKAPAKKAAKAPARTKTVARRKAS